MLPSDGNIFGIRITFCWIRTHTKIESVMKYFFLGEFNHGPEEKDQSSESGS
ncbi:hypothetical protein LEP1GSC036_1443 [Leptospira weilii str. 2006001853]|uniref:Uncharacterized protein n=2 Tax=Leptospira TaxID=171 RepID=A0A828Z5F3_9LEPT|nr:hypothetical protein LEP1GSC036_1443 [Leptospira weilii str. 2006001853]EQA63569.1 hypothetical protein LEP1GSC062_2463 [Leptospira alexanderi serovar Manhao 3 str. L 60]